MGPICCCSTTIELTSPSSVESDRLGAWAITPVARIAQPDDKLFRSIVRLLFADRGLHMPEDCLKYIADRVERSYWMAERVVETIDRFAIAERARLTLPTVRRALAEEGIIDAKGAA